MSSPTPRRPSPAVYRRRRLAVLVALLVVVLIVVGTVWLVVARPWEGAPASVATPGASDGASEDAAPSATPGATPDAGPSDPDPSASTDPSAPVEVAACERADLLLEPLTDKDTYAVGELPRLTLRLTNRSTDPCTLNVGTSKQTFTVSSGNDVWWRSTDCQTEPSDMEVTLTPGQVVESAQPITWDRTRSSVSTCDGERPRAAGGGASYHFTVSLDGIEGAGSKQFLLY